MLENGKFPTAEELLERRKQLTQKAADGKKLSGEETYFLELLNISLAKLRDEQEKNCVRPLVEQLKKANPFVQDVFRSTEYFEFALWCIEIPTPPVGAKMTVQTTSAVVGLRQTTARPTRRCVAVWKA